METKHEKNHGNAFMWGVIFGALLATLLTTKRGRQILRELTNLGLELFEDFVEERTRSTPPPGRDRFPRSDSGQAEQAVSIDRKEDVEGASEDIESEITEVESVGPNQIGTETKVEPTPEQAEQGEKNGNGHKRRLFKGVRRK